MCQKKAVNLDNYDYPCNCRIFEARTDNTTQFTPKMFERSLMNYNNLKLMYIDLRMNRQTQSEYTTNVNSNACYINSEMICKQSHLMLLFLNYLPLTYIVPKIKNTELCKDNQAACRIVRKRKKETSPTRLGQKIIK